MVNCAIFISLLMASAISFFFSLDSFWITFYFTNYQQKKEIFLFNYLNGIHLYVEVVQCGRTWINRPVIYSSRKCVGTGKRIRRLALCKQSAGHSSFFSSLFWIAILRCSVFLVFPGFSWMKKTFTHVHTDMETTSTFTYRESNMCAV